jgi:murein DD-endopeptidase MepM/ murein hydrolase activator NlpD
MIEESISCIDSAGGFPLECASMILLRPPIAHVGWLALTFLLVLASLLAWTSPSSAAPRVRPQPTKDHGVRKASSRVKTPRDGKSPRRKRGAATDPRLRAILWAPQQATPEILHLPTAAERARLVESLQDEIAPPDAPPVSVEETLPSLVWPVTGTINSPFGPRHRRFHAGLDIGAPRDQSVLAAADGAVLYAGPSRGPMGIAVVLQHAGGLQTIYAHLSRLRVREGALVFQGDQIGTVGCTGRSTGPHLHFGVRVDGTTVNPQAHLPPLPDSPGLPLTAQATEQ